jgi:hypothetical protein
MLYLPLGADPRSLSSPDDLQRATVRVARSVSRTPKRRENLKLLGLRTTQLFRGFTILGFSFKNGANTRDKVNSCTIASVITFK